MKHLVRLCVALSLVASFAACGEDNTVGEGVDLGVKNQVEQERLGQRTTTTAAAAATTAPPQQKAGVGAAATTTAPPTTAAPATTQAPQQVAIEIAINADTAGAQFDPSQARVFVNSLVKWTNRDSVARSVEADDGSFNSGMLNPGQSFTYKASKAGRFNYTDGTRPYAVGALEVVAR